MLKARVKALRKAKSLSERETAELVRDSAKTLAPYHSGTTMRGIRMRKKNDHYVVESWVPGVFKQNLFADQRAPFRTLKFKKPNRFFAWPQTVVYGRPAKSASGNAIRWTGTPRFFHLATLRGQSKFGKITRRHTKKALRVSIG